MDMATRFKDHNIQTAEDIGRAREHAKLDVPSVRAFIHGGEDAWEAHQRVEAVLSLDPVFDKSQRHFLSRKELFKIGLAMQNRIEELAVNYNWTTKELSFVQLACDMGLPLNLHVVAFEPVILSQGSPELIAKYGALIKHKGIIGCYLQTELGHGTNVAQLETTATYFSETDDFEIHSPTLTSTKWWIGALGKTATHGVIQARLILPNGKDCGPHLFFVQLRSLETHEVLPGIKIGDIGPKVMGGVPAIDNGFARFDHLRIPRSQMLSKFAQVTREGKYVTPPHAKLSYGGMLYIRSTMVTTAGRTLAKAATISIRYSVVRRQGNTDKDGLERQVISYPSVHYRLLPILSRAYVYILLGRDLMESYTNFSEQLARKETSSLSEMHAVTSGLKVLVSTTTAQDVETARRSMGGHGYSAFSGLGHVYADYVPSATFEGDNFVLDQQVVRAALKSYRAFVSIGAPIASSLSPSSNYLRLLGENQPDFSDQCTWETPRTAVNILDWRAVKMVQALALAQSNSDSDASQVQRVSRAVTEAYAAAKVYDMMESLPLSGMSAYILKDLLHLYLLVTVEAALVDILSFGLLRSATSAGLADPTRTLRASVASLCIKLLPESISLTDAFGFTDWELDSALGVRDGRVYEALWKRAQTEPLNENEITNGFNDFIKPLLERGRRVAGQNQPKHKL